jgi:hypothetical protein
MMRSVIAKANTPSLNETSLETPYRRSSSSSLVGSMVAGTDDDEVTMFCFPISRAAYRQRSRQCSTTLPYPNQHRLAGGEAAHEKCSRCTQRVQHDRNNMKDRHSFPLVTRSPYGHWTEQFLTIFQAAQRAKHWHAWLDRRSGTTILRFLETPARAQTNPSVASGPE